MSDLDTRLAALRDDLRTTITPPDLGDIGERTRRRTVRRRTQIGSVAAVVAVSVAVPLLRALPDADPPAEPPVTPPMTFELDFADADHGYALGTDCEDRASGQVCAVVLLATGDGGRSWARRTLPDGDKRFSTALLTVADKDRLAVDRSAEGDRMATHLTSQDGGRTWRNGWPSGVASPAPLPGNAWVQTVCVDQAQGACRPGVSTPSQDGERMVPAPARPPLVEPRLGDVATEGGRFWATGIDEQTGKWAISVSSDRGRTWTTTPLEVPGEPAMVDPWALVERDGVMYLTLQGSIAKGPYGLLSVFRSTDDGLTWENTWRATADTVLQAALGSPVATGADTLLVYSAATGTYESRDGGRTFRRSPRQLSGEVTWTRGGYLAKAGGGYQLSADGTTWRTFGIR